MMEQSFSGHHLAAVKSDGEKPIERCIEDGLAFVLRSQDAAGWWRDFSLFCGKSDLWVTGYIGTQLMTLDRDDAHSAANRAWQWLASRSTQGWGYNGNTPCDADSTLWCLQLAQALNCMDSPAAQAGLRFLNLHVRSGAGVSTYAKEAPIRAFIQAPPHLSLAGWTQPHSCVTNAAAQLNDLFPRLESVVCASQLPAGCWPSYWWCSHEYATAQAAQALHQHSTQQHAKLHPAVERAAAWALTQINVFGAVTTLVAKQGSAFATAWALTLMTLSLQTAKLSGDICFDTYLKTCARCANWLMNKQQSEGSWAASAGLRVPPSNLQNPDQYDRWCIGKKTEGGISRDDQRLFTTVTVMAALKTYHDCLKAHQHRSSYHVKSFTNGFSYEHY